MREREGETMKQPPSNNKEKHHQMKEESSSFHATVSRFFYLAFITLITIFFLQIIFNNVDTIQFTYEILNFTPTNASSVPPSKGQVTSGQSREIESCDLFKGRWIRDTNASFYTQYTCKSLPTLKNCFLHGRKDKDYLNWKWKPDQCELPRFDALSFFSTLRGKKMMFIGDSLARNHVDSLLCMLSAVETPNKKEENKDTTWVFPKHNFTLSVIWSQFLVVAAMIHPEGPPSNGFRINLDRIDPRWFDKLPSTDYVIFSDGHWFLRWNYLYEGGKVIGCTNCQDPNVTDIGTGRAIGLAFRAALRAVNGCEKCGEKRIVSFVRTYSPGHFEGGAWNGGGWCNRTLPIEREEVDRARADFEYRRIQEEEVERARREGGEKGKRNEFEILDATEVMATRADGHPGPHWKNGWKKNTRDCVHWCLPGPIDTWNGLLFEKIKRLEKN